MNASVTFACVCRSGGVYSSVWIERLCRQVREHLKPDRMICLLDGNVRLDSLSHIPPLSGVWCVPLPQPWPSWYSKICAFAPGLFAGRTVYADLDSLLLAPIDFAPVWAALEKGPERLALLSDFFNPRIAASGVMAWLPGPETERIYRAFAAQPEISSRWDRGDGYHIGRHPHLRLQSLLPGVFGSYKANKLQAGPRGFAHVSFHGLPKNNSFPPDHWVSRCWVGANTKL